MKQFNLIQIVNYLPVFFFVLAISPNISSARIGLSLVAVYLLLVPSANYMAANPGRKIVLVSETQYSFLDFVSLAMLVTAFYLGWLISWQFNFLQGLYLFVVILSSKQERVVSIDIKWLIISALQGLILFAVTYLGLNQYEFNNLLRIHILLFSFLSAFLIITSLYISNLHEYYFQRRAETEYLTLVKGIPIKTLLILIGLILLTFTGFFITTYNWYYAGYFSLALLPIISILVSILWKKYLNKVLNLPFILFWINTVLALCLIIFFIYFFLDSTQVLQAIRGGY